jgi:hypothetical protein
MDFWRESRNRGYGFDVRGMVNSISDRLGVRQKSHLESAQMVTAAPIGDPQSMLLDNKTPLPVIDEASETGRSKTRNSLFKWLGENAVALITRGAACYITCVGPLFGNRCHYTPT